MSNGDCPYCALSNPNCHHIVFCSSADAFWSYIWYLLERMEIKIKKRERIFGYQEDPLVNSVLFLALVILYRRFIYNVNSGKTDFDLIKSYKQLLYEKIYIEYIIAKSNNTLVSFSESWGNGKGLFRYTVEKIDIRL